MQCIKQVFLVLFSIGIALNAQAETVINDATIVTLAAGDNQPFNGHIVIEDGKIKAIEKGLYHGDATVIDAKGKIVMPGFVSGHSHLWQSAFRGIAADKPLFPWLKAIHWTYGHHFIKDDFYQFTLHGALDQLRHGITTTYNHTHRLGDANEELYLEQLDASLAAGQHFIFAYRADLTQPDANIKQTFESLYQKSATLKESTPLLDLSINAVAYYTNPAKLPLELSLAKTHGITAQLHYLEQFSRRFHDRSNWAQFKKAGAVADNISYAHFIHPTDKILQEAADHGVAMIWNPLSNGRLGSGLADIPKYQEIGLGVGMGVDGAASADISDPFENMRMGLYALRMQHKNPEVMSTIDILRLHTLKTAEVLKVADRVGSLEVGKFADLLIIDPSKPSTGAVFDPVATLVFACNAVNIDTVMVGGEIKVQHGKVLDQNMPKLENDVLQRIARLKKASEKTP